MFWSLARRSRRAALSAVAALLLAGCSAQGGPLDDGSGGNGIIGGVACIPNLDQAWSVGNVWLDNTSAIDTATLVSVELGNDSGRPLPILDGSYVIPSLEYGSFGTQRMPPPEGDPLWSMRQDLADWQIPPGEGANIVLIVLPNGSSDSASDWFEVTYSAGGKIWKQRSFSGFDFTPRPDVIRRCGD